MIPNLAQGVSEWLLEDLAAPGNVRRGKIDRLVFDGESWWILDYKTSRPEPPEDWENFIARETEKYRPQLLAYREMTAKAKGLRAGRNQAGPLFHRLPEGGGGVKFSVINTYHYYSEVLIMAKSSYLGTPELEPGLAKFV